jgi:thiol reductant ABC exporter CydC subunit
MSARRGAAALGVAAPTRRRIALAALLGAGAAISAVGLMAVSAWLISRAAQHPGASALGVAVALVQLFALSRGLLRYGERLAGHDAALRALAELRVRAFRRLEALAPAGLEAFRSGDLLARLVHDVDAIQDLLLRAVPPFAVAVLGGAVTVGVAWLILPAAGAILLAALVLAATAVPLATARRATRAEAGQARSRGELSSAVVDLLHGAPELVANGAAERRLARAMARDEELARSGRSAAWTAAGGRGAIVLLTGLAMWGCLLAGALAVHARQLDAVLLASLALVPLAAAELVAGLPAAAQVLQRTRRSAARVHDILGDSPPYEGLSPLQDPPCPQPVPRGPHRLRVRGLRVRYGADGPWVLDGLDLDLEPGKSVAVVGPSGAGKSTLAEALLRLVPYEGSIALDGAEIAMLRGDDYRRVIGLVEQDAHVFDTTVEANLRLARPEATEAELHAALARAHLLVPLDEHAPHLSGGERRRLTVARGFLRNPPILVLDEPTEHVEPEIADALVADLLRPPPDTAILLITHRLTGLEAAGEIVKIG